jgi:ankyrin repeat protein
MLHVAALMGNTQMVTMLLQFGADLMALTDVSEE